LSCSNCPNPTARPNTPVTYTVTVRTAAGCEATDSIRITLLCGESFHIPTGFTPNADNLNDRFYVMGGGATIRHFRIYNRYGQVIFERRNTQVNDRSNGWDGRFEGQLQPAGAYAYTVVLECFDGKLFEYKGTITLIR
jgi:gliding motility-associated-like protein